MVGYRLSARSLDNLRGVHPSLYRATILALLYSEYDFTVTEGVRSLDRQKLLVAKGASQTLHSKHLRQPDGFGHAVDVVAVGDLDRDGDIDAQDKSLTWEPKIYTAIDAAFERAAGELGVRIRWGGKFKTRDGGPYFDGPHHELVM